jgi:hypothetical protein
VRAEDRPHPPGCNLLLDDEAAREDGAGIHAARCYSRKTLTEAL